MSFDVMQVSYLLGHDTILNTETVVIKRIVNRSEATETRHRKCILDDSRLRPSFYELFISGSYQFCLDNRAARFANKLVHVYLVTFIMEEWTKYANELQELQYTAENFTVSVSIFGEDGLRNSLAMLFH